jgi:hypothetical protein
MQFKATPGNEYRIVPLLGTFVGVAKARAAAFPPPLWGRDREGGNRKC